MQVTRFFDPDTSTFSYVVEDSVSQACAVIDPVMDYDAPSSTVSFAGAQLIVDYIESNGLNLEWILETHVHADHLSAAQYVKSKLGGKIAIGANISQVQATFSAIYNFDDEFATDGSQFDVLMDDGFKFKIGRLDATAISTPGHTPACLSYIVGDSVFIGDTLFMPESGTARSDFPGGSSADLYESTQKILSLPDNTKLYMCHDYSDDAENNFVTSVAEQRLRNIHVNRNISKEEFIQLRTTRDKTLKSPRYLYPSIQVNLCAGRLPPVEDNQRSYFKIPINER
jgi:glyoxylase-like metal-dependent hydrolase (beta-lactamase superfamily II)